jgi:anti-sigma regulatory factor (Ser/Thr protein kinase)
MVWTTAEEIICEVHDTGHLTDQRAGQTRPAPDEPGGGRGLWVVRQVCDRVEISTHASGVVIRVHMRRHYSGRQAAGAR